MRVGNWTEKKRLNEQYTCIRLFAYECEYPLHVIFCGQLNVVGVVVAVAKYQEQWTNEQTNV